MPPSGANGWGQHNEKQAPYDTDEYNNLDMTDTGGDQNHMEEYDTAGGAAGASGMLRDDYVTSFSGDEDPDELDARVSRFSNTMNTRYETHSRSKSMMRYTEIERERSRRRQKVVMNKGGMWGGTLKLQMINSGVIPLKKGKKRTNERTNERRHPYFRGQSCINNSGKGKSARYNYSAIWGGGGWGTASLGGDERVGGVHPFLGERVGGYHFFQLRKKKVLLFRAFIGTFGSQTTLKCSKIARTGCLGQF
jgi:hypothetical protein